jgi:hypothetical protein
VLNKSITRGNTSSAFLCFDFKEDLEHSDATYLYSSGELWEEVQFMWAVRFRVRDSKVANRWGRNAVFYNLDLVDRKH